MEVWSVRSPIGYHKNVMKPLFPHYGQYVISQNKYYGDELANVIATEQGQKLFALYYAKEIQPRKPPIRCYMTTR